METHLASAHSANFRLQPFHQLAPQAKSLIPNQNLIKVYDEAPQAVRDEARILFTIEEITSFKWLLDRRDPGWRDRQTKSGGMFGKPIPKASTEAPR